MMQFIPTTREDSLKGTITCSSAELGLESMLGVLDSANTELANPNRRALSCIVQEGIKVSGLNHNKVYVLNFSSNPSPDREHHIGKQTFYETLLLYANFIGKEMSLGSLYLDFDGKIEVLETDI